MIQRKLYMNRILPFIDTNLVKIITGIRRSGKSIMLQLIQQELEKRGIPRDHLISYNFESLAFAPLCTAQALYQEVVERTKGLSGKVYLFFDEIQEVENWEKAINSFRVDLNADIYITGSNAKLLSGELATYLAGRYVEFVIYPFSFCEFLEMIHTLTPSISVSEGFRQYLLFGGMPYLGELQYNQTAAKQYLQDLYNAVELKDIIKRNAIRDVDLLERILMYVTANIGQTFSATTISKYLKNEGRRVAPETVMNYLRAGEEAFLFYPVKRQDLVGKKLLSVQEKYYIADHGIREAVFGGNLRDINLVLENIVFLELLRRGYQVTVGKFKDKEVDFIAQKQEKRIYIQVTYLLASEETVRREFGVYEEIRDNYPKYVVSMDEIDWSQNGIIHKNIRDFLLDEKW
ncbi:ATP-binding protein [Acidaminococcus timonensis]|uniref:ATP-binding protein n=1 Tax=Acidaminococcus timonensis TaxID=1871002 RepID=UPI0025F2F08A|nr:ATP-binding protein [uncultured Acidaminococcus sp.]